jgi:DNA helicase HerA-like ATPase
MDSIYLGKGEQPQELLLKYGNRHGLIAGATGTGKTLTLQGMAESFSMAGVPVFIADVKGDLSGLAQAGVDKAPLLARAKEIGFALDYQAFPVLFWDVFGQKGHPVRTTVSEMGPLLLARLLQLNEVQEGVLNVVFAAADAEGMLLLDMDDLRAMLGHVAENAKDYSARYGNVSPASVAAVQRALLVLEQQGGAKLFGEPALEIQEFMRVAPNGYGAINILCAEQLMQSPRLYALLMLWLLSELFEDLPEVGDVEKPKLVFFFDEAHLLFDDAPKALVEKIEQLVRLIRSKGVGVYFVTQNPSDIPPDVLGQLAGRVQHALRAFTPQDQKAVRAAAQTFRANPAFKTEEIITQLAVGEALVSTLDAKGVPTVVERTLIRPVHSLVGMISDAQRAEVIVASPVGDAYDVPVNRESAYEMLAQRVEAKPEVRRAATASTVWGNVAKTAVTAAAASAGRAAASAAIRSVAGAPSGRRRDSMATAVTKSVLRSAGGSLGRQLVRGLLQSLSR